METYEFVGESIDHLVNLDVRPPHLEQGLLAKLYKAAREKMKRPLTLLAAEKLKEVLTPENTAIISTGFVFPPHFPAGEMDGPPGAVALGKIINKGIGSKVFFLGESAIMGVMRATCAGAGIKLYEYESSKKVSRCCTLKDFPLDVEEAKKEADQFCKSTSPPPSLPSRRQAETAKAFIIQSLGATCLLTQIR